MLTDEILRAQACKAAQTEGRNARHEVRSRSKSASKDTSFNPTLELARSTTHMEDHQYRNIIDTIPKFSGESRENITDWLDIVSLKFNLLGYDSRQKRRFIPQYLAGNTLKWHLTHREELSSWEEYILAFTSAFPRIITTSRDLNLRMLQDRKQGVTEPFTECYASVIDLCYKHDPNMADFQIIDWLKA
ncbi:unnamed protein product, partial [Rotaria sordida]